MMPAIIAGSVLLAGIIFSMGLAVGINTDANSPRLQPWQIDPNQQCPGCGHASGHIKFDESLRTIIHTCAVCQATWGEATVVKVGDWRAGRPPQENPPAWP